MRKYITKLTENLPTKRAEKELEKANRKKKIPKQFRKDNIIFIHVPKCAGSAFFNSYLGYQLGHIKASRYHLLDPDFFDTAFSFTFVRHPIHRFISAYNYLQRTRLWKSYIPDIRNDINAQFSTINDLAVGISDAPEILKLPWFEPQHLFLEVDGKISVNRVFKTESLTQDLKVLVAETGIVLRQEEDVNRSAQSHKDYKQVLSEQAIQHLETVYEEDFTLFGYY